MIWNNADVKRKLPAVATALALWATGAYLPWKMSSVIRDEVTQTEAGLGTAGDHPAVAAAVALALMSTAVDNDWLFTAKALPGNTATHELLRLGIESSVDTGGLPSSGR
jgi:hypothetical protein